MNKQIKWIIVLFLFFIGLFAYMKDYGYCQGYMRVPVEEEYLYQSFECRYNQDRQAKPAKPARNAAPNARERQHLQDAYDDHHFHAVRTYNDAYNRVWFLPNLTWRQVGRDAWIAACAMAATKQPTAALVVAFSTLLSQYGLHCLDEWDYIQEKLRWSQYHFEQCAHYATLLNN